VAEETDGGLAGFLEVDLRSAADGCDESRPVSFMADSRRGRGVGAALLAATEKLGTRPGLH
jgi:hypothetical protein